MKIEKDGDKIMAKWSSDKNKKLELRFKGFGVGKSTLHGIKYFLQIEIEGATVLRSEPQYVELGEDFTVPFKVHRDLEPIAEITIAEVTQIIRTR